MTTTNGVWTDSPTSYAYQWHEGGSPVGTNSNTYVSTTVGAMIDCAVTATNAGGSTTATATAVGPVIAVGSLATPTLTNYSSLGTAPLVLQWSTADYVAGYRAQLQIDNNSDFSSPEQNIIFFIDGASWALADESINLVTPSGTYYARIRTVRDNQDSATVVTGFGPNGNAFTFNADVSAWSTTFTDNISAASTTWFTGAAGANRNQYVTVSGSPALVCTGTNTVGAACGVRATASKTGKKQFEVTYTTKPAGGAMLVGVEAGTATLGPATFPVPNPGIVYKSDGNIYRNGAGIQSTGVTAGAGDVITCEFDTTANTVTFYKNGTQIGSTVTTVVLAAYTAYNATFQADVLTANFGQSSFTHALNTGYTAYG